MKKKHPITVLQGDGIGPEIMDAVLHLLQTAGASLEIEKNFIEKGEIKKATWDSIRRTKVILKSPITTPQGGGFKSLNVTLRTTLGLFANIRPCVSYHPFIKTKHPNMDVVIVRENEEDLYAGIEYRQSGDVCTALKLISRPASERIIRYAFEYARRVERKKVTCFTKDNILKLSDGLFHKVFSEIAKEYPDIESEHWIVDIGMAKLAATPEVFDVIVLPNLYGDILSDIAGQIAGSIGLVGTANVGLKGALFEAIHGSAPDIAGKGLANPSGLLLASVLMLVHIHQTEAATRIHNAWLKTIEDGIHTKDIYCEGMSQKKVGTQDFTDAVASRLGKHPVQLKTVDYAGHQNAIIPSHIGSTLISSKKELVGVDITLQSYDPIEKIVLHCKAAETPSLKLEKIFNRGTVVWPEEASEIQCVDQYRCRFFGNKVVKGETIASLMHRFATGGCDVVKLDNLYTFDGNRGFSH
ncbi:MAG: NADP-dependent isocitrate dehydrogenase [Chlamydiia bacterium]|nr:NADP-dependent isocitrate dehydrogenase [Chlamydiia bacterium]